MKRPSVAEAKPAATYEIDPNLVRALAELLTETDLSEIEVEKGDLHIRVARHSSVAAPAPVFHHVPAAAPAPAAAAAVAAPAGVLGAAIADATHWYRFENLFCAVGHAYCVWL